MESMMHSELDNNMKRQVFYVTKGVPHLVCALSSIETLKYFNPNIQVVLLTECANLISGPFSKLIEKVIEIAPEKDVRDLKTSIFSYGDGVECLFLDADTLVLGRLDKAFELLEHFDLAIRPHPAPLTKGAKGESRVFGGKYSISDLPHWNSGVVFFRRSEAVDRFFQDWNSSFHAIKSKYDQVSLVEALFRAQIKLAPLNFGWNATTAQTVNNKSVVVQHYTSDITHEIEERLYLIFKKALIENDDYTIEMLKEWVQNKKADRLLRGKSLTSPKFDKLILVSKLKSSITKLINSF